MVRTKRVYDEPTPDDGFRVLVDRLWPRGVRKDGGAFDLWLREVAPSSELRRWYGHEPARFAEFTERYRAELTNAEAESALRHLRELAGRGPLTLLTATKQIAGSHVAVLAELVGGADGR